MASVPADSGFSSGWRRPGAMAVGPWGAESKCPVRTPLSRTSSLCPASPVTLKAPATRGSCVDSFPTSRACTAVCVLTVRSASTAGVGQGAGPLDSSGTSSAELVLAPAPALQRQEHTCHCDSKGTVFLISARTALFTFFKDRSCPWTVLSTPLLTISRGYIWAVASAAPCSGQRPALGQQV